MDEQHEDDMNDYGNYETLDESEDDMIDDYVPSFKLQSSSLSTNTEAQTSVESNQVMENNDSVNQSESNIEINVNDSIPNDISNQISSIPSNKKLTKKSKSKKQKKTKTNKNKKNKSMKMDTSLSIKKERIIENKHDKNQRLLNAVKTKFGTIPTGFEWMNHSHPLLEEFNNLNNQKPIQLGLMKDKESELYLRRLELQNYKLEHGIKNKSKQYTIKDEIKELEKLNNLIYQSKQMVDILHDKQILNDEDHIQEQLQKYMKNSEIENESPIDIHSIDSNMNNTEIQQKSNIDINSAEDEHSNENTSVHISDTLETKTFTVKQENGIISINETSQQIEIQEEEIPLLIDQEEL